MWHKTSNWLMIASWLRLVSWSGDPNKTADWSQDSGHGLWPIILGFTSELWTLAYCRSWPPLAGRSLLSTNRPFNAQSKDTEPFICKFQADSEVWHCINMDNSSLLTSTELGVKYIENLLDSCPENPLKDPFAKAWIYMEDNYTKFQITAYGSFIIHEVLMYFITLM